eukprot:s691_g32.t1
MQHAKDQTITLLTSVQLMSGYQLKIWLGIMGRNKNWHNLELSQISQELFVDISIGCIMRAGGWIVCGVIAVTCSFDAWLPKQRWEALVLPQQSYFRRSLSGSVNVAMRLLLALLGCQVLGNAIGSPLNKAIELIDGLKKKVEADGLKQEEAYKKYKDWCETQTAELLREVETQKKSADKAAADIYEAEAAVAASAAAVEKLASQVARADAKLQGAKDVRAEDHKAFKASEVSLMDTISTLDKAAEAVSGNDADKKKLALQQMSSDEANHATDMLLGLAAIVDSGSAKKPALLQDGLEDEGMEGSLNGDMQNQDLLDLLQKMSKEAEKNLAELRQKEEEERRAHELLTASLKRQLDEDGRSLSAEKNRQRAATVLKAKLEGDRTGAADGIQTVQTTLRTTQDACMQAAADEEASGIGRRKELQVLSEAAKVLQGAAEGVSFLQLSKLSATRRAASSSSQQRAPTLVEEPTEPRDEEAPERGHVVVKLLGRLAKQQQSPVLAQLAGKISTALRATRGDPLASVRKMVQDLILKMQDGMQREASEEAYCKTETSRSEARIKSLQNTLDTAQSEIDVSSSSSTLLGAEIDKQREELEALAKEQAQMTGALDEMKQDYEKSKVDLQKGLEGIQAALEKLQSYYGAGQPALIQKSSDNSAAFAQVEEDASSKEVAIMAASMDMDVSEDQASSDAPKEDCGNCKSLGMNRSTLWLQELQKQWLLCRRLLPQQPQNQILTNQKDLEVERKTKDKKSADAEVRRLTEELETAKNELQPLQEYYQQVKERCDKRTSREEIMRRRDQEIAGLKEALAVLEGEALVQVESNRVASFLQRRVVKRAEEHGVFVSEGRQLRTARFASGEGSFEPRALILDCDGVIADSEHLHREAYNEVFAEFGLDTKRFFWSKEYYDELQNKIGGGKPKMRYHFGIHGWPTSSLGAAPKEEADQDKLINALQDRKTEIYRKYVADGRSSARPGIMELIDTSLDRPDLKTAICSAGTREAAQQVLMAVLGEGRLDRFDLILLGDDVSRKKPDPLIYRLASERLGVATSNCAVVEDSKIGLEAALAAGMKCYITYTDSTEGQDFGGAVQVVADATKLDLNDIFPLFQSESN